MSTVISFGQARRKPVRDVHERPRPEGGAEVVILPVVRIERHEGVPPHGQGRSGVFGPGSGSRKVL